MSTNNNKCQKISSTTGTGLHYIEIVVYSLIWVSGVIYSIYRVYLKSQEFLLKHNRDIVPGWKWTGLQKDNADLEWSSYLNILPSLLLLAIINIIVTDIISAFLNKYIIIWYHVIVGCLFSFSFFGFWPTMFLNLQLLMFYITSLSNMRYLVWFTNLVVLALLNSPHFNNSLYDLFNITNSRYILWCITIAWNVLRGTSYALDAIDFCISKPKCIENAQNGSNSITEYKSRYTLAKLFAYCGFLPTMITGPIILYNTFEKGIGNKHTGTILQKYQTLTLQICRYVFWLFLTEAMLHFLYTNAMEHHPKWVEKLTPWEMYGYGYLLGQFFLLKYVVIYGVAGTLTKAHEVDAPRPPKCIARIHRYSDMWRYFDPGLYSFLFRYVYLPSRSILLNYNTNPLFCKMCSSLLCFAYIYVWHGTKEYILLWSILNYLAISIETLSDTIEASSTYRSLTKRLFSYSWQLRINCILTCPLLAMSAISNFYFFAGLDIGNIFLRKFLFGHYTVNLILFGFLYSACNVSHKIKIWENNRLALGKKSS